MHADPQLEQHLRDQPVISRHVAFGVLLCLVIVCTVFWRTTFSMVAIWDRSETFAHGFAVLPIFLYLLWQKRALLATLSPQPSFVGLFALAGAGVVWLLGELSATLGVTQFAMMAMVPLMVWTVMGTAVVRVLVFPLAFLFFAVPFGEFLVPKLMDWTADFVIAAVQLSGVPVWRESNFFVLPTGNWSVVEACSGLRYLIASFMVGCLFAYLTYQSTRKRVTFILVSIAVPIVANWLRAYMIVMLGHLSSNRLATGIDHVIYGWIFFGVVMAVLFAIGARWREDESAPAQGMSLEMGHSAPSVSSGSDARVAVAVVASILTIGAWPLTLARALHGDHEDVAALARISGGNGWSAVPDTITKWRPELVPPSAIISQTFEKNGVRAGLYVALYRGQTTESKAISSRNALVRTTNKQWRQLRAPPAVIEAGADSLELASAVVEGHRQRLAVWRWYWVDGRATSSDFVAKLLQLVSIVRGHGDAVAWVIIYTPIGADEATPWRVLNDFASAIVGRVNVALAGTTND